MRVFWLVGMLTVVGLVLVSPIQAEQEHKIKSCKKHPMLSGSCFRVKGLMSLYNGTPSIRIWPVGTKRLLGVSEGHFLSEGYDNIPKDLEKKLNWDTEMFADFFVCPFTNDRPGVMRLICVESAENISIRKRK